MGLRRVSTWRTEQLGFLFVKKWKFYFSTRGYFAMSNATYRQMQEELAEAGIVQVGIDGDRTLWWTRAGVFWEDTGLAAEDVLLLVLDRQRRQDAKLDRLRRKAGGALGVCAAETVRQL